jgi:hypothetical protein
MIELEFRNVEEGGNPEKNPRSKGANQQQTQLTCVTNPGIEPEIAVVRGERLAATPPMLPMQTLAL